MKIAIRIDIYNKLQSLAKTNNIPMEILLNKLLTHTLNHQHGEIEAMIQKIKERKLK